MFSRVRSAIVNAVGGLDNSNNQADGHGEPLTHKFPYSRPHFLNLNIQEEVPLSADHRVRPIIVPRDRDALPWSAGYAECVNSGKSLKNEDQATAYQFILPGKRVYDYAELRDYPEDIQVTYFGMFDGHAGYGAAVSAARQLHFIIEEKLLDILPYIWEDYLGLKTVTKKKSGKIITIRKEHLIIGALEQAFLEMDQLIAEDKDKYLGAGGCTALVILLILDTVYISNAGDSRAIHCKNSRSVPMSFDMTPESEDHRIRKLAESKPELLCGEYTWREYQRDPKFLDLGKQILFKDASAYGWAPKTITKEDLKQPVISGEGKRSRLMNTIGVTRGFGDHDLKAINSKVPIKPFLSAHPEVNLLVLRHMDLKEEDVLIAGTDGLWDVTANHKAAEIVDRILTQFSHERHKYISSAQALVANARGKPWGECSWRTSEGRTASGDDISVFVIPLINHWSMFEKFEQVVFDKLGIVRQNQVPPVAEPDIVLDIENLVSIQDD